MSRSLKRKIILVFMYVGTTVTTRGCFRVGGLGGVMNGTHTFCDSSGFSLSTELNRPSDKETLSLERQQGRSPELLVSLSHPRVSLRLLPPPPFFFSSPPSIHFFLIRRAIYMSSLAHAERGGLGMERSPRERRRRQVEARVRVRESVHVCV